MRNKLDKMLFLEQLMNFFMKLFLMMIVRMIYFLYKLDVLLKKRV